MSRFIALVLAFAVLFSNTGLAMHVHYCMGKAVGFSLIKREHQNQRCSHCGMKGNASENGCCKDEYKLIKSKDCSARKNTAYSADLFSASLPEPFYSIKAGDFASCKVNTTLLIPHRPPKVSAVRLYVLNCVFRI